MGVLETIVGIIIGLSTLLVIILFTKKWGIRFLYIVLSGFGIYVLSADPGIGIALSFIVIMSYLVNKFGDFKKSN